MNDSDLSTIMGMLGGGSTGSDWGQNAIQGMSTQPGNNWMQWLLGNRGGMASGGGGGGSNMSGLGTALFKMAGGSMGGGMSGMLGSL